MGGRRGACRAWPDNEPVRHHTHSTAGPAGVEGAGGSGGPGRASRSTTPSDSKACGDLAGGRARRRRENPWRHKHRCRSGGRPDPTVPGTPSAPQAPLQIRWAAGPEGAGKTRGAASTAGDQAALQAPAQPVRTPRSTPGSGRPGGRPDARARRSPPFAQETARRRRYRGSRADAQGDRTWAGAGRRAGSASAE